MTEPAWVLAIISAGGVIFQGGIGWATLEQIKGDRKKNDARDVVVSALDKKVEQHEWRITSHDARLHTHDIQIDKLRGDS